MRLLGASGQKFADANPSDLALTAAVAPLHPALRSSEEGDWMYPLQEGFAPKIGGELIGFLVKPGNLVALYRDGEVLIRIFFAADGESVDALLSDPGTAQQLRDQVIDRIRKRLLEP